jgi:hypothetical protein
MDFGDNSAVGSENVLGTAIALAPGQGFMAGDNEVA